MRSLAASERLFQQLVKSVLLSIRSLSMVSVAPLVADNSGSLLTFTMRVGSFFIHCYLCKADSQALRSSEVKERVKGWVATHSSTRSDFWNSTCGKDSAERVVLMELAIHGLRLDKDD